MGLLYGGMALFGMGLPWGVLSAGLFYAGLRLALLSVKGLCVTPFAASLAVPPLQGFGTGQRNSRAASPAHGASQPALRESLRLQKERDSGRNPEWPTR